MPLDFTDDKSTLVQVMAWCRQAASHYLGPCWPRMMSPNGVIRPQWVKLCMDIDWYCCLGDISDDDMAAHIKPQFQHLMDENYIRSARSWSMLNQQATGSMDFPISSRKTVSLTHLGPRRHSGGSRTHFVAKPSPLAMEDKKALRKSSEPICGSSEAWMDL